MSLNVVFVLLHIDVVEGRKWCEPNQTHPLLNCSLLQPNCSSVNGIRSQPQKRDMYKSISFEIVLVDSSLKGITWLTHAST
jgi:hypothetical protein